MKTTTNNQEDIEMMHQAALLLVGLDEAKKLSPELREENQRTLSKAQEVLAKDKELLKENAVIENRLQGETLMFANMIRNADVIREIQATAKKNNGFWYRFKVLLGWV